MAGKKLTKRDPKKQKENYSTFESNAQKKGRAPLNFRKFVPAAIKDSLRDELHKLCDRRTKEYEDKQE